MAFKIVIAILMTALLAEGMSQETASTTPSKDMVMEVAKNSVAVRNLRLDVNDIKDKASRQAGESAVKERDLQFAVQQMKVETATQATKVNQLMAQFTSLQQQNSALQQKVAQQDAAQTARERQLQAQVEELKMQGSTLKDRVDQLEKQSSKAFAVASFDAGASVDINSGYRGTIVYGQVNQMSGRQYDSTTGKFTADIRGIYAFQATITNSCSNCEAVAALFVDNKNKGEIFTVRHGYGGQSSMSYIVELQVGHVAEMRLIYGDARLRKYPFTKFSGFLIKAL